MANIVFIMQTKIKRRNIKRCRDVRLMINVYYDIFFGISLFVCKKFVNSANTSTRFFDLCYIYFVPILLGSKKYN